MTTTPLLSPRTLENAPEKSKPALEQIQKGFGFIPNMLATIANSDAALNGYLALDAQYRHASLTPVEREIVELAASLVNDCKYCTAAHSTALIAFMHVDAETVAKIRAGQPTGDSKTDALVAFTTSIVENRGKASQASLEGFLQAGYKAEQGLEILMGIALKTISNYTDHLYHVKLDAPFQPQA